MTKMWAGRTDGKTDKLADDFNSSIHFDCRMFREDIRGSMAHAAMLAKQGIITAEEAEKITEGLGIILEELESGALAFDPDSEDIHMFVEQILTQKIGDAGKKLPELFMCVGQDDFLYQDISDFHQYHMRSGLAHRYDDLPGYEHEFAIWDKEIEEFFRWINREDVYKQMGKNKV